MSTTPAPKLSLAAALVAAATTKPRPVKDVVADALATTGWTKVDGAWSHPTLAGRTPAATASATILALIRKGALVKPERGQVQLAPKAQS